MYASGPNVYTKPRIASARVVGAARSRKSWKPRSELFPLITNLEEFAFATTARRAGAHFNDGDKHAEH